MCDRAGVLSFLKGNCGGYGSRHGNNYNSGHNRVTDAKLVKKELHYVETYAKVHDEEHDNRHHNSFNDSHGYGCGGRDGFGRDGYGYDGCGRDGYGYDGYGYDGFGRDGCDRPFYNKHYKYDNDCDSDRKKDKKDKKDKKHDDKPCNNFCQPCHKPVCYKPYNKDCKCHICVKSYNKIYKH